MKKVLLISSGHIYFARSQFCLPLKLNHLQESKVIHRESGKRGQKDSESTTSSSSLGKKQKQRSRRSTRSTEEKLRGLSSARASKNTQSSVMKSGTTSSTLTINLNEQNQTPQELLKESLPRILKTKHCLIRCKTPQLAEKYLKILENALPKEIGVTIIRESTLNCYEIIPRSKEEIEDDPLYLKGVRKAYHKRFENDPEIKNEIKRAKQRKYWAERNKKKKSQELKRSQEAEDFRIKR